ncbi:hypothetical protein LOC71_08335 [Rhodopirellula sp. JC740]|uniref:Uncharacterized protein n=1 Tax=Rhodopirellula halodulae TaxID=2894198 RepID=A0ABS8NFE9_9BACT|nr:hypothetical protein [Rhodopirellula sp. JC740]MCC9642280.1 hypothetical protein [Rhodopirellula sp. JC740]
MRTLLLLGLAVGAAFMAGWFTIERDGDTTRIEINKTEIRSDARSAIDRGREILDERQQAQEAQQNGGQPGYPPQGGYYPNGAAANPNAWPPQGGTPVQGAGYSTPSQNPPNYNTAPNYNPAPNYNGYPPNQPAPGYPTPNYGGNAPTDGQNRWDSATAPWNQQYR